MYADKKLNLTRILVPYSHLLCKSTLAAMEPGTVLEIRVRDPDTLNDLLMILEHSGDRLIAQKEQGDSYLLWVQKIRD